LQRSRRSPGCANVASNAVPPFEVRAARTREPFQSPQQLEHANFCDRHRRHPTAARHPATSCFRTAWTHSRRSLPSIAMPPRAPFRIFPRAVSRRGPRTAWLIGSAAAAPVNSVNSPTRPRSYRSAAGYDVIGDRQTEPGAFAGDAGGSNAGAGTSGGVTARDVGKIYTFWRPASLRKPMCY
jgi:hypothetical protein